LWSLVECFENFVDSLGVRLHGDLSWGTDEGAGYVQPHKGAAMTAAVLTNEVRPRNLQGGVGLMEVPTVSVAEAAKLCKVSDDTIRRRLRANLLEGAFQDGFSEAAPWRIPVPALVTAGLCDNEAVDELDLRLNPNIARLANQLVDARAELLAEQTRRDAAESSLVAAKDEVSYLRKTVDHLLSNASVSNEGRAN
jgi:hypothetical protein